jgi:hypothetical protein
MKKKSFSAIGFKLRLVLAGSLQAVAGRVQEITD